MHNDTCDKFVQAKHAETPGNAYMSELPGTDRRAGRPIVGLVEK